MTVKEMIYLLEGMPEDEPVYIPVGSHRVPVDNVMMTSRGVFLPYFWVEQDE